MGQRDPWQSPKGWLKPQQNHGMLTSYHGRIKQEEQLEYKDGDVVPVSISKCNLGRLKQIPKHAVSTEEYLVHMTTISIYIYTYVYN